MAGDLRLDRMAAALPWRGRFRAALGVRPGQRLVTVSSTWGDAAEREVRSRLGHNPQGNRDTEGTWDGRRGQ